MTSHGELVSHRFAFLLCFEVIVQEVDIKACLKHCCGRLGPAEEVLVVIAIDPIFNGLLVRFKLNRLPIKNVEEPVKSEERDVV